MDTCNICMRKSVLYVEYEIPLNRHDDGMMKFHKVTVSLPIVTTYKSISRCVIYNFYIILQL